MPTALALPKITFKKIQIRLELRLAYVHCYQKHGRPMIKVEIKDKVTNALPFQFLETFIQPKKKFGDTIFVFYNLQWYLIPL